MHHIQREITYNHEYDRRLRACFVGAGGHAFRNVYPTFRYAPVDLVGVCDHDADKARGVANVFGSRNIYTDHTQMFAIEKPEVVFIVTGYEASGKVQATAIARDALKAGIDVWMEKPTAATRDEVEELIQVSNETGKIVMTGLKKTFFPAIEKLREIILGSDFGGLSSLTVRYPQALPPPEERRNLARMRSFLDHIYHPGAILNFLGGPIERATYEWTPSTGASIGLLKFRSGAVGTVHFAAGASGGSPLERIEAVGNGANAIVENGVRLIHYRSAERPSYGRAASFIQSDDGAALLYEPEFSLGQLCNNNMFTLGYVPEVLHFCDAVLAGHPVTKGTLNEALEIMKLFDFFATAEQGVAQTL